MKLFLGQASNYRGRVWRHFFAHGSKKDALALKNHLAGRFETEAKRVFLTANGRSALCLALRAFELENSEVVINGFTCHAVLEAVREAHCTPVFADIERETLDFSPETLKKLLKTHKNIKAVILQNSMGGTVDVRPFEKIAKEKGLILIEDLAHCAGRKYPDGREVGTVGEAAALSFGKGKAIDTITGGALVLRAEPKRAVREPTKRPKLSDYLRARFYPIFGAMIRGAFYVKLNKIVAFVLLKLHFIERSADAKLSLERRPAYFQAKLALEQLEKMPKNPKYLREFEFVREREEVLEKLRKNGFVFDEIWYDVPISPARYYKKSGFIEADCPVSTEVAKKIVNLPTWYEKDLLRPAQKIIKEYRND